MKYNVLLSMKKHYLCAISVKPHEALEMFDELESEDEINAEEAQELHQVLYRIKTRLDAAKFPAVLLMTTCSAQATATINKLQERKEKVLHQSLMHQA
ncbi:hypothetical protein ACVXSW_003438 [Vibrio parahaemolyticus]